MDRSLSINNEDKQPAKKGTFFSAGSQPFFASVIQPKLTINQPGDACEQEADAIAETVMRTETHKPANQSFFKPAPGYLIQQKCAHCEKEEEELQRKEDEEENVVSRKAIAGFPGVTDKVEQTLQSSGHRMDSGVLDFMGSRFGVDFSRVQIHNDAVAQQSSKDIHAKAYTHQNHVVFGSGQYQPDTNEGKKLIAHELTHVVQQTNSGVQRHIQGKADILGKEDIQRKPVDEPRKYGDLVKYDTAIQRNLDSWYATYKFFDIFKEDGIYPVSAAYVNHVVELQKRIETETEGKWHPAQYGILEDKIAQDSTLGQLMIIAENYHKDPSESFDFDVTMLERIYGYMAAFDPAAPPLISGYFAGVPQLEAVNKYKPFHINFDDRGYYVIVIQEALQSLNYSLGEDEKTSKDTNEKTPTGVFGKGTQKAVINFQHDSGLEGKDADGVIGQVTLRLLDQRLGAPLFKSHSRGNGYGFHVPVTADDLLKDKDTIKAELLLRLLKIAFPISDDQVTVLLNSGWHWTNYTELTQEEVSLGYKTIVISKTDYESVIGITGNDTEDLISKKLELQALGLLKTGKLYELNKKIEAKQIEAGWAGWSAGNDDMHHRPTKAEKEEMEKARQLGAKLRKELDDLIRQRDEELRKLGITLEEYEKMKDGFVDTFEKFAAQTAFKMLSENEMQGNIEFGHYKNMEEVQAVKKVLSDLSVRYADSVKLWWQAVSVEEGNDSGYYTGNGDYYSKNSDSVQGDFGGGESNDRSNPDNYYNEANIAKKYAALEKTPSANYTAWHDNEKALVTLLQGAVKKYPILVYPKLDLRENAGQYAALSDDEMQKKLQGIVSSEEGDKGVKQNIQDIREKIRNDYSIVWKMPVVILRAKYEIGVMEGTVLDNIITDKQKQLADKAFWEGIGLAVLGIGLGLLALASGPVGWLALGASIAVGSYDAYKTLQDIEFKKATAGTAIDPQSALGTDNPSYFWFWVSLVCIGLDVLQAAKLVKAIAKGAELADDVAKGLSKSKEVLEEELKTVGAASERGKQIAKEMEEIDSALAKVNTQEFADNYKLLEPLKTNPMAVVVMSEALKDKRMVKAVLSLSKMADKETFEMALQVYAGVGKKSIDELPELVRIIETGGLNKNAGLMKDLFTDTRIQRVLLDNPIGDFASKYSKWQKAIADGESVSLLKFLEREGLHPGFAADTKLADMFGEGFAQLSNGVKNRQILRTIEPRLLDAFNAGKLPAQAQKAMEAMLNADLIATSTRLSSVQERLLQEIGTMGSVIESQSDLAGIMIVLDRPAARKALWDGASQLIGKDEYWKLIVKCNKDLPPAADVLDDMIRIGPMTDEGTVSELVNDTTGLRKILADSPEAVAVLKKCASPCLPSFISPDQVWRVRKIMEGKSPDDILRIREYLYSLRSDEDTFKKGLTLLEMDAKTALKEVKTPLIAKPAVLDVSDEAIESIIKSEFPVSELNKIMNNSARYKWGEFIIYNLKKVLDLEKNVPLKNFDKLVAGLGSSNQAEFLIAEHLLDEASNFKAASTVNAVDFKYAGLQKVDELLGKFSLGELDTLMKTRWTDGFANTLYDISAKIPGAKYSEILDLANKAGKGGKGDLGRVGILVDSLKKPTATLDEVSKAIEAANAFGTEVEKAMKDPKTGFDAMVKLIWGEKTKVENDVIKVKDAFAGGSETFEQVMGLGKADQLAEKMVTDAKLDMTKWEVFKKVINQSNIDDPIKNLIKGKMWEYANIKAFKAQGFEVFAQKRLTTVLGDGKGVDCIADAILVRNNEMYIVELKSGGAVYERGQDVIYPLLEQGKFKNVIIANDEKLAAQYASKKFTVKFQPVREADMAVAH